MRFLYLFAAVVGLAGCAFSPVEKAPITKYVDSQEVKEFSGLSKDAAMDIARSALQSTGYEVISFVPELGEIRTKTRLVATPAQCDCGTWNGNVVSGNADSVFIVTAKNQGENKVGVKAGFGCAVTFSGKNLYGAVTKVESYNCASRGVVEGQFWERFREIDMVRKQKPQ